MITLEISLTDLQAQLLALFRAKGAEFTAAAAERAWRNGEGFNLDDRNGAGIGNKRRLAACNAEALSSRARLLRELIKPGETLTYDDGREQHRGKRCTVLQCGEHSMLVQFEDRADTTTIAWTDTGWTHYLSRSVNPGAHVSALLGISPADVIKAIEVALALDKAYGDDIRGEGLEAATDAENLVWILCPLIGWDVEADKDASEYLLKATMTERLDYALGRVMVQAQGVKP